MQVNDDMVRAAVEAAITAAWTAPEDSPAQETIMRAALTAALAHMWRPSGDEPKDRPFLLAIDDDGVEYHVAKFIGADKKTLIVGGAFGFDRKGKRLGWCDIAPITLPSPPKAEG